MKRLVILEGCSVFVTIWSRSGNGEYPDGDPARRPIPLKTRSGSEAPMSGRKTTDVHPSVYGGAVMGSPESLQVCCNYCIGIPKNVVEPTESGNRTVKRIIIPCMSARMDGIVSCSSENPCGNHRVNCNWQSIKHQNRILLHQLPHHHLPPQRK